MPRQTFIAFDTETTGLDPQHDQIIEIAAVKFVVEPSGPGGQYAAKIVDEWESLAKPTMMIPEGASAVNHITNEMVENEPPISEVLEKFRSFCGQTSILVAHNAPFDCAFVAAAVRSNGLTPKHFSFSVYDSLKISRNKCGELASHKLSSIARAFRRELNLPAVDASKLHRACYDCEVLAHVFAGLLWKANVRPAELDFCDKRPSLNAAHGGEPIAIFSKS